MNERTHERTNIRTDKRQGENYIPRGINAGGIIIFFGVVSMVQLVEVTDSAVLGGVAEVVSLNPTLGHEIFFSIYPHS